jgi:polar amino acid transport system substrate-binding protein
MVAAGGDGGVVRRYIAPMHIPIRKWLVVVVWACGVAFGATGASAAPNVVRLGIGEYPPFKLEAEPGGGPLTEIVVEAFKAKNITATVDWVPNNRAIAGVMAGHYEGSFGWAHNPERDEALLFSSKPIYTYRMVFVQRAGESRDWASLADLNRARIGITRGNFYSQPFADLQAQGALTVDEAADDSNNLMKLLRNRVDLFPLEESVARYLIASKLELPERRQLQVQEKAFWTVPIYFVVSKKAPNAQELIDAFDAGYRELQRTRRIEVLERKLRK